MKAKKSLGQNFLVDNNIINKIIDEVSVTKNDLVIEIGPGRGALTSKIKEKGCNLIAYELDQDLKSILSNLEDEKLKVIYNDFLKVDIKEDIRDINYNNLYIVGNLPYYITTPIIEHIIDCELDFKKLTIMVQKEVAQRFTALPKSKDYGYITVVLNYYFKIEKVVDVSRYAFSPVPKVDSTVISLIPRENKPELDTKSYFNFLKSAFKQKRKTLKNNLDSYKWQEVENYLEKNSISKNVRAEELDETTLIDIYKICLFK